MLTIKNICANLNEAPKVTNLTVTGFENTTIDIEYRVEDIERTVCRHYLILNGARTEITKNVGYESPTNTYRYKITNLAMDTTYTIQIRATDGIDEGLSLAIRQKTKNYELYGVRVDETNSNPSTSVSYIEGAVGVSPATPTSLGGWFNKFPFNKIRIVGMKNGQVTKEINPNNKAMYTDGYYVPSDVDVMVEFPKFYWKWTNTTTGYELRICDQKLEGFDCYAHKKNGVEKDFHYVGVYLGYEEASKLRSRSGVMPTGDKYIGDFRTLATNVGAGYTQYPWFTCEMLQILYTIAYKNLNSQSALGMGYVKDAEKTTTGGCDTKGMVFGSTLQTNQMCFLGIEDLWGNGMVFLDGIVLKDNAFYINPTNQNFNDSGKNYEFLANNNISTKGFVNGVLHTNKGGFLPTSLAGSSSTYYSDQSRIDNQSSVILGMTSPVKDSNISIVNDRLEYGIFATSFEYTMFTKAAHTFARLCYL